jgi:hypothetical protein
MKSLRGVTVKKGILLAAAVLAIQAMPQAQGRSPEEQRRRNEIRLMEGVLERAVRLGAEEVGRQLEKYEPTGVTVLTGTPRARGFVLDGYGVFFDVEIPDMSQSVVWSLMVVQRDRQIGNALDSLHTAINSLPAGPGREQAQDAVQQISKVVGPPPRAPEPGQPPPGRIAAANVNPPDPNALYSEAVKAALVEAMMTMQVNLGADEWLTVAARASESPVSAAGISDSMTIILRVKGSDLAAYWSADQTKREEFRKKVKLEARVF